MSVNETTTVEWRGTCTDEEQPKLPLRVGIAVAVGALLWTGPYLGITAVLQPAKVAMLAGADQKATILAMLSTVGMVSATIANIVFGALSDMTRSRWGRRTPWMIFGSIATFAVIVTMYYVNSVPVLITLWGLEQVVQNALAAPLLAVIADRVAPRHRGVISSIYAFGGGFGPQLGQLVGAQLLATMATGYWVMAGATLLSGPIAALLMREPSSLGMPKKKFDKRVLTQNFSIPLHDCRDFYFALFGKFLIVTALFAVSTYQLYIFTDYMGLDQTGAGKYISIMSVCSMGCMLVATLISGPVSDKIHSRRIPVMLSSVLIGVGVLIPFINASPWTMVLYSIIASGIGNGIYSAVDQALNIEVLPDPNTAAKDLGILNLAACGGQIVGPIVNAALIATWGYRAIFPCAAVFACVGAVFIFFIKKVK
ncbi:MFS transporter [Bifidobacterium simiarum]|uniref:MFS transporter n=1 Tax=Bifidobacterium simiarum TaxID=2045441 RepID=UPI001BDD342E|nr:MFS transporter [Bifidobacterium simiarum]MBT1166523.1 MFS transporter [Bifidobacterium simiarum]